MATFRPAGLRAFFCSDVDRRLVEDVWIAQLQGSVVEEPAEADIHFSDDPNNPTARLLIEPKSIRAATTLVYETKLIEAAVEAKNDRRPALTSLDVFLLPPALYVSYIEAAAARSPPPQAEMATQSTAPAARPAAASDRAGSRSTRGPAVNPSSKDSSTRRRARIEAAPLPVSSIPATTRSVSAGAETSEREGEQATSSLHEDTNKGAAALFGMFVPTVPNDYGYTVVQKPHVDLGAIGKANYNTGEAAGGGSNRSHMFLKPRQHVEEPQPPRRASARQQKQPQSQQGRPPSRPQLQQQPESQKQYGQRRSTRTMTNSQRFLRHGRPGQGRRRRDAKELDSSSHSQPATSDNLDSDMSQSESAEAADLTNDVDARTSRALKRLHKRVNGDVELVAQFVSETMDRLSNDRVRWTRALDSKLRTACAGVAAPVWEEVSKSVGPSAVACQERWQILDDSSARANDGLGSKHKRKRV